MHSSFYRATMRLEPNGKVGHVWPMCRYGQGEGFQFGVGSREPVAVLSQKQAGCCNTSPFITIHKRVVIDQRIQQHRPFRQSSERG